MHNTQYIYTRYVVLLYTMLLGLMYGNIQSVYSVVSLIITTLLAWAGVWE